MRFSKKNSLSIIATLMIITGSFSFVWALPEGENVVDVDTSAVNFDRSASNILTVTTALEKLIINFQSFSIASGETVNFIQPATNASVLNRVIGNEVSNIFGTLNANGNIFLVNPNGINIGPTANINVASLVASTLNISVQDFLNGNYNFSKDKESAFLINQGNIIIRNGGYVCLLSQALENKGVIQAELGRVVLAAGEKMTLALDDLNEISVVIDEPLKEAIFGPGGQKFDSAIRNTGTISAHGGKVLLTAKVLNDVFYYAINNSGLIEAKSLENHNGVVELMAEGAPIYNIGKIEAGQINIKILNSDFINKGEVIADKIEGLAGSGLISIKAINVTQDGLIAALGATVVIEADSIKTTLNVDPAVATPATLALVIRAHQVNIAVKNAGTAGFPVAIDAPNIYFNRTQGNIDILESLGIGTSILLRGPPDGFGEIIYNKDTNLTLDAEKVTLLGPDPIYFYGNITFHNFNCTIPDKEIYFEAGKTYTILGDLVLTGGYGQLLNLRSSVDGQQWMIDPHGSRNLEFISVKDSYNIHPEEIVAIRSNKEENCFNWDPTTAWTGNGAGNNWSTGGNWDTGVAPPSGNDVAFNGAGANGNKDSTVDAAFAGTIRDLLIQAGYTGTISFSRSLSGRDFNQAAGTVNLGSQSLTLSRDFTISGGTFNGGSGTIDINDDFMLSGGTFNANSGSISIADNFTISGTGVFSEGTSTVTFTGGAATINILTSETFFNLTFAPTTADANKTVSNNDTLIVSGTLALTEGNINQGTIPASGTISAQGDINQASTFDGGSGKIIIDGTSEQTFTGNATTSAGDLPDLTINKTGGTLTLAGTIRTDGQGAGAWTYIAGTVDATTNNSLIVFNNANTIDGQGTSATMAFDNVEIRGGTATLAGDLDVNGNLTIVSTLNTSASNFSVNVAGNWSNSGTFTSNSSVVTFDGAAGTQTLNSGGSSFYNLTHSGAGTLQLTGNALTVTNNLNNSGGTWISGANAIDINGDFNNSADFTAPSGNMNVAGNWTNNGTFNANGGTVVLDGNNQTIWGSSSTTFNNLNKTVIAASTLTFENAKTQTILGTLTLQGTSGELLSLRSDINGQQWNIDPQGSRSISYVDVKDSNNINGTAISPDNSTNSGNNINWQFIGPLDHFEWAVIPDQTAGTAFTVIITAKDASNNTTTLDADGTPFTGSESVTFTTNALASPSGQLPTYNGDDLTDGTTVSVDLSSGSFTTNNINFYNVAAGQNLTLTHDSKTGTSGTLTVLPGLANNLTFIQQPTNTDAGADITPVVTVEVRDAWDNLLAGDNATSVTIDIQDNPSGGVLSGTLTKTASAGLATFDDLSINNAGAGYTLLAQSAGLTGATSDAFDIITTASPLTSANLESQLSNSLVPRAPLPGSAELGFYQFSPFNPGGPVYLYHPLTPTDMSAFEEFILEEGTYEFIEGAINIIGHNWLLLILDQIKKKADKT